MARIEMTRSKVVVVMIEVWGGRGNAISPTLFRPLWTGSWQWQNFALAQEVFERGRFYLPDAEYRLRTAKLATAFQP
jgi:hypothetical protein